MKILQLCLRVPYPPKDGGALAMHELWRGLTDEGHPTHILALNTFKHHVDISRLPPEYLNKSKLLAEEINTEVNFFAGFFSLFSETSYNVSRFYSRSFSKLIQKRLNEETYDIVIIESLFLSPYVEDIRKVFKGKVLLRAHNVEHQLWEKRAQVEFSFMMKKILQHLARKIKNYELSVLNKFDAIISISDHDKAFFSKHTSVAVFNLPYTLNINLYKPLWKAAGHNIFFIGSLDWAPNREGLLWFIHEIWPLLKSRDPMLRLSIAGRNARSFPEILNDPCIKVHGEVESSKDFMNDSGIFIVPLLSGSGMRVKIVEGLALGKAIVATSKAIEGIDCTAGDHLMVADTPDEFIKTISRLLTEPEEQRKLGEAGRRLIEDHYNSQKQFLVFSSFLENLIRA